MPFHIRCYDLTTLNTILGVKSSCLENLLHLTIISKDLFQINIWA